MLEVESVTVRRVSCPVQLVRLRDPPPVAARDVDGSSLTYLNFQNNQRFFNRKSSFIRRNSTFCLHFQSKIPVKI